MGAKYSKVGEFAYVNVTDIYLDWLEEGSLDRQKLAENLSLYQYGYCDVEQYLLYNNLKEATIPLSINANTSLDFLQEEVLPWLWNNYNGEVSYADKIVLLNPQGELLKEGELFACLRDNVKVSYRVIYVSFPLCC